LADTACLEAPDSMALLVLMDAAWLVASMAILALTAG
jgi:hypothetical protein